MISVQYSVEWTLEVDLSDWQQKGSFGLSAARRGLAISATSEITPHLSSHKEVGKFTLSSNPNSSNL